MAWSVKAVMQGKSNRHTLVTTQDKQHFQLSQKSTPLLRTQKWKFACGYLEISKMWKHEQMVSLGPDKILFSVLLTSGKPSFSLFCVRM